MESVAGSLSEKVFQALSDDILSGRRKSGENLTELKLCNQFGVSRTPVREALRMLEQKGLCQLIPNRGAVVLGVTNHDLRDIYTIRACVEGLASCWAAERATDEELQDLREMVELQEFYYQKHAAGRMNDLDSRFHQAIYECCRSRPLEHLLTDLHHQITLYRRRSFNASGRAGRAIEEHRHILEALEARDGAEAARRTGEHVKNARDFLFQTIDEEGTKDE